MSFFMFVKYLFILYHYNIAGHNDDAVNLMPVEINFFLINCEIYIIVYNLSSRNCNVKN